ncbi:MAG: hypothetical protein V3R99_03835, partial [Thermoguttaceae bacterium]
KAEQRVPHLFPRSLWYVEQHWTADCEPVLKRCSEKHFLWANVTSQISYPAYLPSFHMTVRIERWFDRGSLAGPSPKPRRRETSRANVCTKKTEYVVNESGNKFDRETSDSVIHAAVILRCRLIQHQIDAPAITRRPTNCMKRPVREKKSFRKVQKSRLDVALPSGGRDKPAITIWETGQAVNRTTGGIV